MQWVNRSADLRDGLLTPFNQPEWCLAVTDQLPVSIGQKKPFEWVVMMRRLDDQVGLPFLRGLQNVPVKTLTPH